MNLSRRQFIITTGTLAAGSGLLTLGSCNIRKKPAIRQMNFDYTGPHEYFKDFRDLCRDIRSVQVLENTFEQAVSSSSPLVCLTEPLNNKAVKLLMLLEQGKDILVLPPLATDYDEFNAIQLQCNTLDNRLALINPFRYFPSFLEFKRLVSGGTAGNISKIEISIDPDYTIPHLPPVEGITGSALLLITTINEMIASFPVSVGAELTGQAGTDEGRLLKALAFDYEALILNCHFIPGTGGWKITAGGEKKILELNDTGELLSESNEVLVRGNRQVMTESLGKSIEDFVTAARNRNEPESNSAEGLTQIIINRAVEKATTEGGKINLVERPYYYEDDKVWLQKNYI